MRSVEGIVTIVQEGRFQLVDDRGVGHQFLLSYRAGLEPEQLPPLQRTQARVRVWFERAPDVIGHVARRIELSTPLPLAGEVGERSEPGEGRAPPQPVTSRPSPASGRGVREVPASPASGTGVPRREPAS